MHNWSSSSLAIALVAVALASATAQESSRQESSKQPPARATKEQRLAAIGRAKVWLGGDVNARDLRAGPEGHGAIAPFADVPCEYVNRAMTGASRKFTCELASDDRVKVKYGAENREVSGAVAASRLLWALGFGADRWYPARVICHGCSTDPFFNHPTTKDTATFELASIERPFQGHTIESREDEGWTWTEFEYMEGGGSRTERDALKLLAVFMQHTDTKGEQQRLVCLDRERGTAGQCESPFLYIHDVGLTFGKATTLNTNGASSVNFENWAKAGIWQNQAHCVGDLPKSASGTLNLPTISEAGRKFLADQLEQLSDRQITDLFEVARVPQYSKTPVEAWVAAFKEKRATIVSTRCPA